VRAHITDAQVERACTVLKRAIEAAENSNQAGEDFVVAAAVAPELLAALRQNADWESREFEFPADWHEQIDACEECQRYAGHPVQQGICNTHRRPLWDRETHDANQRELRGLYARGIARAALAKARGAA
jgi:hypothetical protein